MSETYKTPGAVVADAGRMETPEPIRFDTKVVVLLRDDLEPWQALNVTAFLVSGIAAHDPELIGEPYEDADGTAYLAMIRQPIVVFEGDAERLTATHAKAVSRGLAMSVYIREMFSTGNDRDNRAAVRAVARDDLDLVGIAVHGPKNAVDKTFKGAQLHR
jgi:hypothetical protein